MKQILLLLLMVISMPSFSQDVEWFFDKYARWGLKDETGKVVLQPRYHSVREFVKGYAGVRMFTKWGFINTKGEEVVAPQYDDVADFGFESPEFDMYSRLYANVKKNGKTGKIDASNKEIIPALYDGVGVFSSGIIAFKRGNYWYYSTNAGRLLFNEEHYIMEAFPFIGDYAFVRIDDKYFIVNRDGGKVFNTDGFDVAQHVGSGHYVVASGIDSDFVTSGTHNKGKWGIVQLKPNNVSWAIKQEYDRIYYNEVDRRISLNKNGKWGEVNRIYFQVGFEAVYDKAYTFEDNLAVVVMNNRYGVVKSNYEKIIPPNYDLISYVGSNRLAVKNGKSYGVFDANGKEILPIKYDEIGRVINNVMAVKFKGRWGFFDVTGKQITPFRYENYSLCNGEPIAVMTNSKWRLVNNAGNEISTLAYDHILPYKDRFLVQKGDLWGLTDHKGRQVTDLMYDEIKPTENDRCLVRKGSLWGAIDNTGGRLIDCVYEKITPHRTAPWLVVKKVQGRIIMEDRYGFIDKNGQIVLPAVYDYALPFDWFNAQVSCRDEKTGKSVHGMIDFTGRFVIPCGYEYFLEFSEGLSPFKVDNKFGYINRDGKLVLPAIYEMAHSFRDGKALVKLNGGWTTITADAREIATEK